MSLFRPSDDKRKLEKLTEQYLYELDQLRDEVYAELRALKLSVTQIEDQLNYLDNLLLTKEKKNTSTLISRKELE